jgi:hypothetical protein
MEQPENSKSLFRDKRIKRIVLALGGLVVLLLTLLLWQSNRFEEQVALKTQFIEEKNALRDDLDDLIDEHELLKGEYGDLNEQLHDKDSTIQAYAADIKRLLRTEGQLKEAKRKIVRLKEISRKYISAIDSLYTINQSLVHENDSVKKANRLISSRNRTLEQKNQQLSDRVSVASQLQAVEMEVEGVYYRTSGREVITARAAKIQNLRICYTLLENKVAEAGLKELYVRVLDPNGSVLNVANQINETTLGDTLVQYTTQMSVDYANEQLSDCLLWTRGNVLMAGEYTIELILDEELIGTSTRRLR